MTRIAFVALLTLSVSVVHAQRFGGYYNDGTISNSNPYSDNDTGDDDGSAFGRGGNGDRFGDSSRARLIAHAVLATLAFAFFLPLGGIMIRLGSSPRLWLIHGMFQMLGLSMYLAAFALGIWMVHSAPGNMLNNAHPIIGIVLLGLLIFQPILGFVHHLMFKKYSRRTFWSHAHLWLGRIAITLGIINGGLGLQFARRFPLAPPNRAQVIGYSVAAFVMWLLYVVAAVVGEAKRMEAPVAVEKGGPVRMSAHSSKRGSSASTGDAVRYA